MSHHIDDLRERASTLLDLLEKAEHRGHSHAGELRTALLGGVLLGAAIGAGLMYLYDPGRGRERRRQVRGKVTRAAHEAEQRMTREMQLARERARHAAGRASRRIELPDAGDQAEGLPEGDGRRGDVYRGEGYTGSGRYESL